MIYEKLFQIQENSMKVVKGSENPFFKSKFAGLNAVLDMLKPILSENKIVMYQAPVESDGNRINLKTVLVDIEDGSKVESVITIPYASNDPQKAGSAITYARRYALKSLFNMQDVDDDSEGAMNRTITSKQVSELLSLAVGSNLTEAVVKKGWGKVENIPANKFSDVKKFLGGK